MQLLKVYFIIFTVLIISFKCVAQKVEYPFGAQAREHKQNEKNFITSVGFGTSYGGYGTKINYSISSGHRIDLQLGAGYYFEDFMLSGALKLFLWKNLYTDFKYGMYSRRFDLNYDSHYDVEEVAQILVGPGMMVGYELFLTRNLGLNAGGGFNYDLNYEQGISYSYDIGILYKF